MKYSKIVKALVKKQMAYSYAHNPKFTSEARSSESLFTMQILESLF